MNYKLRSIIYHQNSNKRSTTHIQSPHFSLFTLHFQLRYRIRNLFPNFQLSTFNFQLNKGFTLIELLIVIAIIGVLAGMIMTNFSGARARARDSKKKSELNSLQVAFGLYQNVYDKYPGSSNGLTLLGCGADGDQDCLSACSSADFAAGGSGCDNVFMQSITKSGSYFFFRYYSCDNDSDYVLKVNLENKSDPDIANSQNRCANSISNCGVSVSATADYVVCP